MNINTEKIARLKQIRDKSFSRFVKRKISVRTYHYQFDKIERYLRELPRHK